MTTSESASPRTSTPPQKLAAPTRTAFPSRRNRSSSSLREPSPWISRGNPSPCRRNSSRNNSCARRIARKAVNRRKARPPLARINGIEGGKRVGKSAISPDRCRGEARAFAGEREAQIPRRLVQRGNEPRRLRHVLRAHERFGAGVPRELNELARGKGLAEEQRSRLRQLVRLVEDHAIAGGQELRHALVLEHDVGKEQMVVDHDEVRGERLAPRGHHETVAKLGA